MVKQTLMRVIIEDEYLVSLYKNGKTTGNPKYGALVEKAFIMRVTQMEKANGTADLRAIGSLHFELLKGDLKGKYSIRVKDGFRLIFRVEKDGTNNRIEIIAIEEMIDYHK